MLGKGSLVASFSVHTVTPVLRRHPELPYVSCEGSSCFGGRAKKVVSDSPLLVDFVIGLVNSVFNLYYREVKVFGRI